MNAHLCDFSLCFMLCYIFRGMLFTEALRWLIIWFPSFFSLLYIFFWMVRSFYHYIYLTTCILIYWRLCLELEFCATWNFQFPLLISLIWSLSYIFSVSFDLQRRPLMIQLSKMVPLIAFVFTFSSTLSGSCLSGHPLSSLLWMNDLFSCHNDSRLTTPSQLIC